MSLSNTAAFAQWGATQSPYTFGPEGRPFESMQSIESLGRPKDMVSIVPKRPVAAKDKKGNRVYFTPNGKMSLKITKDGKMQFSLKGQTMIKDKKGKLETESKFMQGTDKVEIKNEHGEVLGYQVMGLGGKVVQELDDQGNLTKSHQYNRYGKSAEWVMDELTQTKTIFNEKGEPLHDVNFEGYEVAWYEHDDEGNLLTKTDLYGNVSYFNEDGHITHTVDIEGNEIAVYHYKEDEDGHIYLDYVEDPRTQTITYFKDGRQDVAKNHSGTVIKEWNWDGTKLIFTFDHETLETTWYDVTGKPKYTSLDGVEVKTWLYHEGRLVGFWNQANGTCIIYKNQREEITIEVGDTPPTGEEIAEWIEEGLIDDMREYMEEQI